jgi:hypothetical protein
VAGGKELAIPVVKTVVLCTAPPLACLQLLHLLLVLPVRIKQGPVPPLVDGGADDDEPVAVVHCQLEHAGLGLQGHKGRVSRNQLLMQTGLW